MSRWEHSETVSDALFLLECDDTVSVLFVHNRYSCEHLFQTVSVPEFDGRGLCAVKKFESNQLAANTPNEDRRSAATCLQVNTFSPYSSTSPSFLPYVCKT